MRFVLTSLIILFSFFTVSAQEINEEDFTTEIKPPKAYSPTIGFGIGTLGFYGDLNDRDYSSPFGSNVSYNVFIMQPLNSYLNLRFNFAASKIREEERSLSRNLNFETELRSGGILLEYNFDHILPKKRTITPFVTAGIEVVEFNPKTDLLAFGGEAYNYWSDGTIRNISEDAPNANQSVIIQRDYNYETDIRESGFNGSTTYSERTLSIPFGIGLDLKLNDNFNFKFESIFHYTFTDYIDGVTRSTREEFVQNKRANGRNDLFFYNGISLTYDFQKVEPAYDPNDDVPFDYIATGNTEDFDSDGIIDLVDLCPNTPEGVDVDTTGCPVDTDGDGVPDYKDKEIESEYPELTNHEGVEMTDEMIYLSYLKYIDSTSEFAEVIQRDFTGEQKNYKKYKIKIAEYDKGQTPDNMEDLLSINDLRKTDQNGKSLYTAGQYKTLEEAKLRLAALQAQGFTDATIIKKGVTGDLVSINETEKEIVINADINNAAPLPKEPGVVFRVQLGAFRNLPSQDIYKNVPSLFLVQTDGYYKYLSGSFSDFPSAAKHKIKMVVEGYEGAFVVAYKEGKRVFLREVGVKPIESDPLIGK